MAKAKEKAKEKPAKEEKAEAPSFKYGVADLAKILGVKEASARVQLRNHNIKKAGKSYGWNAKDEVQAVADKIKAPKKDEKAAKGKKKKSDEDDD